MIQLAIEKSYIFFTFKSQSTDTLNLIVIDLKIQLRRCAMIKIPNCLILVQLDVVDTWYFKQLIKLGQKLKFETSKIYAVAKIQGFEKQIM